MSNSDSDNSWYKNKQGSQPFKEKKEEEENINYIPYSFLLSSRRLKLLIILIPLFKANILISRILP